MKHILNLMIFASCLSVLVCQGCSREQSPPKASGPEVKKQQPEVKEPQAQGKENQAVKEPAPKIEPTPEVVDSPKSTRGKKPTSARAEMKFYYFDAATGEMFIANSEDLPPIIRENGNKAFKAYVFSCGSCSNESERFVGYYESFTDKYKAVRQKAIDAAKSSNLDAAPDSALDLEIEEVFSKGRLLSVDGKTWVTSDSPEGIEINIALSKACDTKGGMLRPCYPGIPAEDAPSRPVPVPEK